MQTFIAKSLFSWATSRKMHTTEAVIFLCGNNVDLSKLRELQASLAAFCMQQQQLTKKRPLVVWIPKSSNIIGEYGTTLCGPTLGPLFKSVVESLWPNDVIKLKNVGKQATKKQESLYVLHYILWVGWVEEAYLYNIYKVNDMNGSLPKIHCMPYTIHLD